MAEEEEETKIKQEIIERLATLLTSAFGLIAALAWNEAIKAIFAHFYGTPSKLIPMLLYAIVVTIIVVIVTIWISRLAKMTKK